jgi:hypothetical protein
MSTSERAFNQVKAILQKLDRSIEEARRKRTQGGPRDPDAPAPETPRPAGTGTSGYGRATPIPPTRPSSTLQRWSH